jgi:hypothetical protein
MMFPDLPKNEQNKNEKNNKKEIKFDFGSLWSILGTSNQHKRVFLISSHVTNLSNAEPKLRPDFDFHLFEKKNTQLLFCGCYWVKYLLRQNEVEWGGICGYFMRSRSGEPWIEEENGHDLMGK